MKALRALTLVSVLALLALGAGCGGDDNNDNASTTDTTNTRPHDVHRDHRRRSGRRQGGDRRDGRVLVRARRESRSARAARSRPRTTATSPTTSPSSRAPTRRRRPRSSPARRPSSPARARSSRSTSQPGKYAMACTVPGHRELGHDRHRHRQVTAAGRPRSPEAPARLESLHVQAFGAAASAPVDISFELLEADNPLIRQSEQHDSGWGIAYYRDGEPTVERFPGRRARRPGLPGGRAGDRDADRWCTCAARPSAA